MIEERIPIGGSRQRSSDRGVQIKRLDKAFRLNALDASCSDAIAIANYSSKRFELQTLK